MTRPINFNAGPATLPLPVLHLIHRDLFDWQNTSISVLETGHRSGAFTELGEQLQASVRRILSVPEHFAVLFLQGGAQIQFAMAAMNLVRGFEHANFVETGYWSGMAMKEAQKYTNTHVVASSKDQNFHTIPALDTWQIKANGAFLHFTDNETIGGLEFPAIPELDDTVLVSDMSSNIFSRPIDFSRLGCIYACAQKNLGIAGMSLVIVRRDLLDRALPQTPSVFHYATQDKNNSLQSTPTTVAWYVALLVLNWIEAEGGITVMAERNAIKAQLLYDYLDRSDAYHNPIAAPFRSRMNVPFILTDSQRETDFFQQAREHGLLCLEGHRSVGGARASIYNAIQRDDVEKLIAFLRHFADNNSGSLYA